MKPVRKVEELGKKQFYDNVEKRLKQKSECNYNVRNGGERSKVIVTVLINMIV